MMKVIQTVQSTRTTPRPDPVEIPYYRGDDLAQALASLMRAAADYGNDPQWVAILSVRIDFS